MNNRRFATPSKNVWTGGFCNAASTWVTRTNTFLQHSRYFYYLFLLNPLIFYLFIFLLYYLSDYFPATRQFWNQCDILEALLLISSFKLSRFAIYRRLDNTTDTTCLLFIAIASKFFFFLPIGDNIVLFVFF